MSLKIKFPHLFLILIAVAPFPLDAMMERGGEEAKDDPVEEQARDTANNSEQARITAAKNQRSYGSQTIMLEETIDSSNQSHDPQENSHPMDNNISSAGETTPPFPENEDSSLHYQGEMLTIESFYKAGQANPKASILLHQDEAGNKTLQALPSQEEQTGSFQGAVVTTTQASQHEQTKQAFLTALKQEFGEEVAQWAAQQGGLQNKPSAPLYGETIAAVIKDARGKATNRVFRDKGDTLAGLVKMLRGEGVISGKFGVDSTTFQPTHIINPFPARDFLNFLCNFETDDTPLSEDSDIMELAEGVLFSLSIICEDVNEKIATLKADIAQKEEQGTSSGKKFTLNEQLKLLEKQSEYLTKLRESLLDADQLFQHPEKESSTPDSDRFFKIVKGINDSLSLYDQAQKALEQQDFNKACYLNNQGTARLGAIQEVAGKNRPQIIQGYEAACHLYAQALTEQDPLRATSLNNQGTARLRATQEAAGKNRPEITQGYEAACHLYAQALTEQDPWRANRLNNQGSARFNATQEAAGKNRPEIIEAYKAAYDLYAQALREPDSWRANRLSSQGLARFNATQEAAGKNRPEIIQGYEVAYNLYAQALREQDPRRVALLSNQGNALLGATQEAAGKNRPEITQGYKAASHLYAQALTEQDPWRVTLLNNQGFTRFNATQEAAGKNRPEITQGYKAACDLHGYALIEQDPWKADFLNNQGYARMEATQEAAGKNRPEIIQGYEVAYNLYGHAIREEAPQRATLLNSQGQARFNATLKAAQGNNQPDFLQRTRDWFFGVLSE